MILNILFKRFNYFLDCPDCITLLRWSDKLSSLKYNLKDFIYFLYDDRGIDGIQFIVSIFIINFSRNITENWQFILIAINLSLLIVIKFIFLI